MTVIKQRNCALVSRGPAQKRMAIIPNNGGVSISITGQRGGHKGTIWIDDDDFIEAAVYIATMIKESRRKDQ